LFLPIIAYTLCSTKLEIEIVSARYQRGGGQKEGVREEEGWWNGGEMTQTLYAHMNNKKIILIN
jgi:hypothetical protein